MYTRLTRSRIRMKLGSPTYLEIRMIINNYFDMYKRLTHSRIRGELASPAYLGLGII